MAENGGDRYNNKVYVQIIGRFYVIATVRIKREGT